MSNSSFERNMDDYSYLFYPSLILLLLFVVYVSSKATKSPRKVYGPDLGHTNEKAIGMSQEHQQHRTPVPGISPAYYVGDPSNDVLKIKALDLMFSPGEDVAVPGHLTLNLHGDITADIGRDPPIYLSVYLNGHIGPPVEWKLRASSPTLEIYQKGVSLPDGETPKSGDVTIRYDTVMPDRMLKKGYYTVRVEMYASEDAGKARITGFEGGIWLKTGYGDGCGGWE